MHPSATAPPGFRSAEGHRALKSRAWLVAIVTGLLQIVLPIAVLVAGFATIVSACTDAWTGPKAEASAVGVRDGRIWFTVNAPHDSGDTDLPRRLLLMSADVAGGEMRVERELEHDGEVSIFTDSGQVAAAGGRIFVLGDTLLDGDSGASFPYPDGSRGRPFVLGDVIALPIVSNESIAVHVFRDDTWVLHKTLNAELPDAATAQDLSMIEYEGQLYGFVTTSDSELYALTPTSPEAPHQVKRISTDAADVAAAVVGGAVTALYVTEGPGLDELLDDLEELDEGSTGAASDRDKPKTLLVAAGVDGEKKWSRPTPGMNEVGLARLDEDQVAVVTAEDDGVELYRIEEKGAADPAVVTNLTLWDSYTWRLLGLLFLWFCGGSIVGFFAAWIMAAGMAKHRHQAEIQRYASLTRRALARTIDSLVVIGAVVGATLAANETAGKIAAVVVVVGMLCAEAFSGATAGKWALGIRVQNQRNEPPGFGGTLIRGMLLGIDTMLGGLVGTLAVAFSPSWQRLGDQTASTIVVRVTERSR